MADDPGRVVKKKPPSSTSLIAHAYLPPKGFGSVQPAVHKASTVIFANTAALRARTWKEKTGYTYGLHGTPTTFTLEERIATLEGGTDTLLTPSGLAAITLVDAALLRAGDEVLIPDNAYGPGKELAKNELAGWGITHRFYDAMDPASLAAALSPATRLVWIEAPGSVTMEFPDLPELVRIARAQSGVLVALDNTWGAGLAFDPFAIGAAGVAVDVSVQALTKYPSGGGDVLMGSVTTRDAALHQRLKATHMRMGWGVGGNDAEMVLRSLPSLSLRYEAQDRAGRALAVWWKGRPEIAAVLHPALAGSPGLFSVVFDPRFSDDRVDAFIDALKLFKIGYSWAGPVSLVVPYQLQAIRAKPGQVQTTRAMPAWNGSLVRFSIGLEAIDDLVADCEQALGAFGAAR
jgi:cystathionine beta-lyase